MGKNKKAKEVKDGRNWELVIYFLKPSSDTWHIYFCPEQKAEAEARAEKILRDGYVARWLGKTYWYPASSILCIQLRRKED